MKRTSMTIIMNGKPLEKCRVSVDGHMFVFPHSDGHY